MARKNAVTLKWLEDLPYHQWFLSQSVPGEPDIRNQVLSRQAKDPDSLIMRIAHRFYFKGHPDDPTGKHCMFPTISALLYAGSGAGLRGVDALNCLGWTTQMPAKTSVACLRRVKPYARHVRYTTRTNLRRGQLSWNELTLLEGLEFLEMSEYTWPVCLDRLQSGVSESRMPWKEFIPFRFRREVMLWVAQQEKDTNIIDLQCRINSACDVLTERNQTNE